MRTPIVLGIARMAALAAFAAAAFAAEPGPLRVGAAKVDITSPLNALPPGFKSVHDHVYSRAIVLDNGKTKAVLLGADLGMFTEDSWSDLVQQITKEVGCPPENIIMSGTHTHSSPSPGTKPAAGQKSTVLDSFDLNYAAFIKKGVFESVRQANGKLQPARVGFGTGQFSVNVNRNAINPETRQWYQGPNPNGPSDKTVSVIKFETLSGDPIAAYVTYAMHAVFFYMRNELGGDYPGAMSRYIEEVYDDKMVAVWTVGAAGDQNPLYLRMAEPAVADMKRADIAKTGADPGKVALAEYMDAKLDPKTLDLNARLVNSVGQLLGEEAIRVMGNTKRTYANVAITGQQKSVVCPGRKRTNAGREGMAGTYEDADPVSIRLTLVTVGDIAVAGVTGEPYNMIFQRLRKESPMANVVMVGAANGKSAGYLVTDDAYQQQTFQALGSRMKPGCVESAVVNGMLDMMEKVK